MSATAAGRARRLAHVLGPPLLSLFSLGVGLTLSEGVFTLLLSHPALLRHLPRNLGSHLRAYYLECDRDLIQADATSSRYDPKLFYTLKPGTFRFRNREFDVEFRVNRLGVRDAESALEGPELVVLGDSYAMGWGVRQEATFAKLIEARTGLKTLDAAVSSYGTAREMKLLERVDTRRLRFLVIQYSENDYGENRALERNAGRLPLRPRERYEQVLRHEAARRRYFFGKHTYAIVRGVLRPRASPLEEQGGPADEEARLFVYALLSRGAERLRGVGILVFELNPLEQLDDDFAAALRRELRKPEYPQPVHELRVLDLRPFLRPEHYFDLDDHLRESGHAVVAQQVVQALERFGVREDPP